MALFLLSLAVGYCGSETEGLLTRPLTLATSAVTGSCRRLPKPNKKTDPERDNKRENGGFFIKTSGKATAMLIWLLNVPLKRCLPDGYHRWHNTKMPSNFASEFPKFPKKPASRVHCIHVNQLSFISDWHKYKLVKIMPKFSKNCGKIEWKLEQN